MKVLFLAARDSANFAGVKIIMELMKRGHEVVVYDWSLDSVNVRMFQKHDIKVHYFDELTDEVVDSCDIMFCHTTFMGDPRIKKKLYTFFFNYIYVYGHENSSDFVFTQCDDEYNTYPNKAVMKIGSPKLDRIYPEIDIPVNESKQILVIESGHYPFGKEGREQVAQMILNICKKCPDYTVTVKPRFLPEDTKRVTRKNTDHIYGYLSQFAPDGLPVNLELLREHTDLEQMIYQSHAIVCYNTSAYLEAALSGRGVIYVSGIKSLDAIGDRQNRYWKAFNEFIEDTGIVVPYEKVLDYLPDGLICSQKHLNKTVYLRENVTSKMIDVVEYIFDNYLSKGLYPRIGKYEYKTYQDNMQADDNLTTSKLIMNNKHDVLVYECQKKDRSIGVDIDFGKMYAMIEQWRIDGKIEKVTLKELRKELGILMEQYIIEMQDKMHTNKIDQSILIESYSKLGRLNEIEEWDIDNLLAKDAYKFYMGVYYCDCMNPKGLEYINDYFDYLRQTSFCESNIYFPEPVIKAFISSFLYCARKKDRKLEKKYIDIMLELETSYKYDTMDFDIRCARICFQEEFYEEVLLLLQNWFTRDTSGIPVYRHLDRDVEAYGYLSEISKMKGNLKESQHYKDLSEEKRYEKMKLHNMREGEIN